MGESCIYGPTEQGHVMGCKKDNETRAHSHMRSKLEKSISMWHESITCCTDQQAQQKIDASMYESMHEQQYMWAETHNG